MTTDVITLNEAAYQLIGAGPLAVRAQPRNRGLIYFHFGTVLPAVNTEQFLHMPVNEVLNYGGTQNVYARAASGTITVGFDEVA